eukprot:5626882-Prymnesium_polylepis.1
MAPHTYAWLGGATEGTVLTKKDKIVAWHAVPIDTIHARRPSAEACPCHMRPPLWWHPGSAALCPRSACCRPPECFRSIEAH